MNPHRPKAQKLDSVMTFYVALLFALAAIAVGAYYTKTEFIPAAKNFLDAALQNH